MKVLMFVENDFPHNIRLENEVSILKEYGHTFDVITFTRDKNAPTQINYEGMNVFKKYIPKLVYKSRVAQFKFPTYNAFWTKFLGEFFDNTAEKYDAIHSVDLSTLPASLWVKEKYNIPLIMDLYENYPYLVKNADHTQGKLGKFLSDFPKILKYENEHVKKADIVITTANEMTKRLQQHDKRPERYFLYRNVIDISKYTLPPKVETDIDLIYIGGITSARGIQQVIDATEEVVKHKPNFNFSIVGTGRYLQNLKDLAAEKRLQNNVHFIGQVSQNEAFDYINRSKVCVIPHLRSKQNDNTTSNKIFQYAYHEKPVLTTDAPATVSLMNEMDCGLIYKEGDIKELTHHILHLLANPEEVKSYGENGRKAVLNKFNTKVEGKALQEAYSYVEKNILKKD